MTSDRCILHSHVCKRSKTEHTFLKDGEFLRLGVPRELQKLYREQGRESKGGALPIKLSQSAKSLLMTRAAPPTRGSADTPVASCQFPRFAPPMSRQQLCYRMGRH